MRCVVPEIQLFFRLHTGLVTGKYMNQERGGLRLLFRGITEYLRGLVSVYERPIIAGVRILIVSSM